MLSVGQRMSRHLGLGETGSKNTGEIKQQIDIIHFMKLYISHQLPGGGHSHVFFIRRLGPSIYCLSKKISGISGIFEILATPINIPILYIDLKKHPKMHRNYPQKPFQFGDDPRKYPQNFHTPITIHFSENPKKY